MTEILTYSAADVRPSRAAAFENQGIPSDKAVPEVIDALCTTALELLSEVAAATGILSEISKQDFETVYHGEGRNEPNTPIGDIFNRADDLGLFCVTLGARISQEIEERFNANDLAVACMLDSVASAAADRLAELAQNHYLRLLARKGRATSSTRALRYSPGYCGWHVSGQRKLFAFLRPEQIGISLRDSYLMEPLKSVSGVVISGTAETHDFQDSYPFCSQCATHGCRKRIRALLVE